MKTAKRLKAGAKWAVIVLGVLLLATALICIEAVYQFNRRHSAEPYRYGLTFSAENAAYLGLDPAEVLNAVLIELKPQRIRLVSYWNQIEAKRDAYDFDRLDSEMALAHQHGAKVSLALGLRQPRYPECHYPEWAKDLSESETYGELFPFITAVVERYQHHPALESYQLENEALLTVFGVCGPFSRDQLIAEFKLVKRLDPSHPVSMNVSNEYGLPFGEPTGDLTGFSVYRRVFDARVTKRFVNYPFPPLWFRVRGALIERYIGGEVFIHELQAEPWGRKGIRDLTLAEQDEAYPVSKLKDTERFARQTGIKDIDFWGAEWWYFRKVKFNDPSAWEAAKDIFSRD